MAKGEIKWSSKGKEVSKFDNTPFPPGEYDLKINASLVEISKGKEPGKVPFIKVPFEVLGTAAGKDGKNRRLYHNLFLHLNPSEKDGKNMVERQGGLLDLAQSFGEDLELTGMEVPYQKYKADGKTPDGQMTRIPIARPKDVLEWVKSHDGAVVKAKIKKEKDKGYGEQNRLDYFCPSEDTGSDGEEFEDEEGEEETDDDADEEVDADAESDDESSEESGDEDSDDEETAEDEDEDELEDVDEDEPDDEETDEEPPAPKAKKGVKSPPSKVKQGPAVKGGKKKSKK